MKLRRRLDQDRTASFVAGLLVGCLLFCTAMPFGFPSGVFVVSAAGFIFLCSLTSYCVLTLVNWPVLAAGRFDIYALNRGALGCGLAIGVLGLFVATFEKFRETFSMEPFEAAFSATFGLGIYLGICAVLFLALVKSL